MVLVSAKEKKENSFLSNKIINSLLIFSGALFFILGGVIFWLARFKNGFLVLHYNAFLGIDWLIDSADKKQYHQIFIPLLISGGILLFNIALIQWRRINFLKNIMSSKDKKNKAVVDLENFFIKLILIANLMVQGFFVIYAISLILINN